MTNQTFLKAVLKEDAFRQVSYLANTSGLNVEDVFAYFAFLVEDDFSIEERNERLDQFDVSYELTRLVEVLNTRSGVSLIKGFA